MTESAEAMRRWKAGWRAYEARARAEDREDASTPDERLRAVDERLRMIRALHGWPLAPDPVRERGVAAIRATWAKLRQASSGG